MKITNNCSNHIIFNLCVTMYPQNDQLYLVAFTLYIGYFICLIAFVIMMFIMAKKYTINNDDQSMTCISIMRYHEICCVWIDKKRLFICLICLINKLLKMQMETIAININNEFIVDYICKEGTTLFDIYEEMEAMSGNRIYHVG